MPITLYSISGNAGTAGAIINYSGTSSGSVIADGSGNYTISGLANGSVELITPSLTGNTFTPSSQSETIASASQAGVNFSAGANMAATLTASIGRYFGSSILNAFAYAGTQGIAEPNLDLIQIVNSGLGTTSTPVCDVNVDYKGVVHNPALNPTNGTRIGVFFSTVASGGTTAQFFANAFANPSQLDIIQVANDGGNISYWLDYLGVAHGA